MAIRIQRQRAAGWRLPENTLCVGRPSIWGNPWVGPDAVPAYKMFCEQVVEGVLSISLIEGAMQIRRVFSKPIDDWQQLRTEMFAYVKQPRDVACWCGLTQACHGNLIIALPYLFAWHRAGSVVPK